MRSLDSVSLFPGRLVLCRLVPLVLILASNHLVSARSDGAAQCLAGQNSVSGPHLSSDATTGPLSQGNLQLVVDGSNNVSPGGTIDLVGGAEYSVQVVAQGSDFRGVLLRFGNTDPSDVDFLGNSELQLRDCDGVGAVTHTSNVEKGSAEVLLNVQVGQEYDVDITVVMQLFPSEHYYSSYTIRGVAAPTPEPTPEPTFPPTPEPTLEPTFAPTASPTGTPVASPVEVEETLEPTVPITITTTVVDILSSNEQYQTLLTAASEFNDLVATLSNPDATLTLLAPQNDAFGAVDPKFLTDPWAVHLKALLSYHLISTNAVLSTSLSDGLEITTSVASDPVTTIVNATGVFFTSAATLVAAQVVEPDLVADNGVVHGLNQVLVPTALSINLLQLAQGVPAFSRVAELLAISGLEDEVTAEGRTIFAPSDAAFDSLPEAVFNQVASDVTLIQAVLLNHIVDGVYPQALLPDGSTVTALSGTVYTVTIQAAGSPFARTVLDGDVPISVPDQIASNGLVHVIDEVLLKNIALPPLECYSTAESLIQAAAASASSDEHVVWKICPNTVVDMALSPPLVLQSNRTLQCGDNGTLADSCVLQGGTTHIVSMPLASKEAVVAAQVHGITFRQASEMSVVLAAPGDVTFVDCSFEDHENHGVIKIAWDGKSAINDVDEEIQEVLQNVRDFWESINDWTPKQRELVELPRKSKTDGRMLHAITPDLIPRGCSLAEDHQVGSSPAVLIDTLTCVDYCGAGKTATYRITSFCTGTTPETCENYIDCEVPGCTPECGSEPGDCAFCDQLMFLEEICLEVCPNTFIPITQPPTKAPTVGPTAGLTAGLTVGPTTEPTKSPVVEETPAPVPQPTSSPVAQPVDNPDEAMPTVAPAARTSASVEMPSDLPSDMPSDMPSDIPSSVPTAIKGLDDTPRQMVSLTGCRFIGNKQGGNNSTMTQGIISVETELNDLFINAAEFTNNEYAGTSVDMLGYAVWVEDGSSLEVTNTCFTGNNFTGPGPIVLLGSPSFTANNNAGSVDDNVSCQFIASLPVVGEDPVCVDYDLAECSAI